MAKVIAFNRKAEVIVTLLGMNIAFKPDENGIVSADVADEEALARFADIPSDYRVVADKQAAKPPAPAQATMLAVAAPLGDAAPEAKAEGAQRAAQKGKKAD